MNERWKKGAFLVVGGIALIGAVLFQQKRVDTEDPEPLFIQETEEEPQVEYIYVDIKGAVEQPGVYKLLVHSRLFQAIQLAGGLREDAFGDALNLSIILKDQDVIYVPDITEDYPLVIDQDDLATLGGIININYATLEELESLPGIGPSTAQKIIDYREESGLFTTIEDIMNVSGIGESTFDNIRDYIAV